jgi:hypothetical protein
MSHWVSLLPDSVHEVNYERLLQDPETEIREMLQFCNLEFEPGCMAFHETQRAVKTASFHQVRQPLYQNSKNRWLNYQRQLQPLANILGVGKTEPVMILSDNPLIHG